MQRNTKEVEKCRGTLEIEKEKRNIENEKGAERQKRWRGGREIKEVEMEQRDKGGGEGEAG